METLGQVFRDGELIVAVDLATDVSDQGKTKEEDLSRLKIGLKSIILFILNFSKKIGTLK
ncbi:hypothetical protein KHC33_12065 [Methanospirillum sp. J.3.6.1-F.2.7.3]|jgi:hypothetical protein|uniref:Uncharacterized protein n=1 Tax=Methanospirillum purgamenti TaxID=2834276 RepID=A0A8E7EJ45_9EURY|nr:MULTISPECIES: hypothetical protein [Methanospirillum]MDX8550270.1 hypothetical protein [Methanospirillum hungatei]QVV88065.1 hypothetical protein KHC33_12065 [Methanospirillum sp. J.3.6.1-F.2.7.3]